jgi:outer membrane lipoprotein-sorting protein
MKWMLIFALALATNNSFAAMTAEEILTKVREKYSALQTYRAEGATISDVRPAGVTTPNLVTNSYTIKLAKPNLFHIEWSQPLPNKTSNDGITWGDGMGNFIMSSKDAS